VFFIPVDDRGAHVMVCDEICLNAVRDHLSIEECLPLSTSVVCATCYACSLTVEGTHCPCARLGVSCCRPSWLLSAQPRMALDAIYEAVGPTMLSDTDWEQLETWAEEVWNGGLVGLLWVRDHQPGLGRS
jgi:hypothetical protein